MGVADNKSYKDMYHFNDKFRRQTSELPSLNVDPKINSTIKENLDRANVEIEGDEIVLKSDLSALFRAVGKKHLRGGMSVQLDPGSFIFSDDKSLNFSDKDHKMFELEEGGRTPADVLRKNLDIKHYNKMIANIQDVKKDDLAKRSSTLMLEKYLGTLGNIAFLQEQKKRFPQGVPEFAQGTAPVYNPDVKNDIMEQKQYAKFGGRILPTFQAGGQYRAKDGTLYSKKDILADMTEFGLQQSIDNGYLTPIDQNQHSNWGLWRGDKLPGFQDRYGVTNAADKINSLDVLAQKLNYSGPKDNKSFQKWLYNSSPENRRVIDKWHSTYNVGPNDGMFDGKIGIRWQDAINEITNPSPYKGRATGKITPGTAEDPYPTPNPVTGDSEGWKSADWEFTPWQRASQAYQFGKYAGVKRYMPYRSQINPAYQEANLVNPEQAVGDLQGATNTQINALNTLNPILRNAQASALQGNFLDKTPGVRSAYDNQNAGILNQVNSNNVQIANDARLRNVGFDQQYYKDSVTGRTNFDNMKTYLADQAMNNVFADAFTNQALAYQMLTQKNPAYRYDFRTGRLLRNKKDIRDVEGNDKADLYTGLATRLYGKIQKGEPLSKEEVDFFKGLSLGKIPFSQ